MKPVMHYKRRVATVWPQRLMLRSEANIKSDNILFRMKKGLIFTVFEEDTERSEAKDSYLWAKIILHVDDNPGLELPDGAKGITGFVAICKLEYYSERV